MEFNLEQKKSNQNSDSHIKSKPNSKTVEGFDLNNASTNNDANEINLKVESPSDLKKVNCYVDAVLQNQDDGVFFLQKNVESDSATDSFDNKKASPKKTNLKIANDVSCKQENSKICQENCDTVDANPLKKKGIISVDAMKNAKSRPKNKQKKQKGWIWTLKITVISLVLSILFSFLSDLTASTGNVVVTVLLLVFLILGSILFDAIGVAVTACELTPFVSMSSKKVFGAKTALKMVKNASKVSSICCDVIGDIFGIISGACSIVIVMKLLEVFQGKVTQQILTIIISSVVAAFTVGGKAFMKTIAMKNSKDIVLFVSKFIGVFNPEERRQMKKEKKKKEQQELKNEKNKNADNKF